MKGQLSLGEELRDQGMARVDSHEPQDWKDRADGAIRELAASGEEFSANDVRALVGDPEHFNAMGPRFAAAAKAGLIRFVAYRPSERPSLHAHRIGIWVGSSPKVGSGRG